jgi:hypothetical protein
MAFNVKKIIGGGTLVFGTDNTGRDGRTILHSTKWDMYLDVLAHNQANEVFDSFTEAFFKPLTDAAAAAEAIAHPKPEYDWTTLTISEGKDGEEAVSVDLTGDVDGIVLRILHEGRHDLLTWAADDVLVAIAS